jgi:hypothetical protein
VQGVLLLEGAELPYFQAAGRAALVLGGGIVAPLALGALELNYFSRHVPLPDYLMKSMVIPGYRR